MKLTISVIGESAVRVDLAVAGQGSKIASGTGETPSPLTALKCIFLCAVVEVWSFRQLLEKAIVTSPNPHLGGFSLCVFDIGGSSSIDKAASHSSEGQGVVAVVPAPAEPLAKACQADVVGRRAAHGLGPGQGGARCCYAP